MIKTAILTLFLLQQAPAENVDWDKEFGVEERVRDPETGEFPVEPYQQSNENAGAKPFQGEQLPAAFGGREGIQKIADRTVELSEADPRISDIFVSHDMVRLKRTLGEQFCYLLGAGCDYSGRDMRTAHAGLGATKADLNALVENLQKAMREAKVPFADQNKLLSKLAPMSKDVTER
ncbi:group I truncated hemoglobin [Erythrobacter crassostreae]|uniref:group I truncated hemoglobin n=1 Tax=Erythrobacter crassostreae TaxID=2828328 RepID=UPI0021071243|nr:group 1 truncated hemoglobin [Erythrobacter crassostrea]